MVERQIPTLVIAEADASKAAVWAKAFRDVRSAEIKQMSPPELNDLPGLDMEVVPAFLAHERYGGRPEAGAAHVLSTRGEEGMPPWVIATPVARVVGPRDGIQLVDFGRANRSAAGLYEEFSQVFCTARRFMAESGTEHIMLGFSPCLFGLDEDLYANAEAIRRAYLECFAIDEG
jgi:hypothetical protein